MSLALLSSSFKTAFTFNLKNQTFHKNTQWVSFYLPSSLSCLINRHVPSPNRHSGITQSFSILRLFPYSCRAPYQNSYLSFCLEHPFSFPASDWLLHILNNHLRIHQVCKTDTIPAPVQFWAHLFPLQLSTIASIILIPLYLTAPKILPVFPWLHIFSLCTSFLSTWGMKTTTQYIHV